VITCDDEAVAEPITFRLLCGNGLYALDQLTWTDWGAAQAHATGVYMEKDCDPNCADGTVISYPIEVEADSTSQQDAATVYGAITLRFPGAKPDWVTGDVAHYTLDEDTGHGNGNGVGNG